MFKIVLSMILLTTTACSFQKIDPQMESRAREMLDRGIVHLRDNELDQAQSAFNLALDISNLPAAIDGLGCVAFLRQDYETAHRLFIKAWKSDKTYVRSLANLALLYEVTANYELARETYQLALEKDPLNYQLRNNYAVFEFDNLKDPTLNTNSSDRVYAFSELLKAQQLSDDKIILENVAKIKTMR